MFALEGVQPNLALGGKLIVHFALPTGESATLALIDVAGRRIVERAVGSLGVGHHAVDLAGCAAGVRWGQVSWWMPTSRRYRIIFSGTGATGDQRLLERLALM